MAIKYYKYRYYYLYFLAVYAPFPEAPSLFSKNGEEIEWWGVHNAS